MQNAPRLQLDIASRIAVIDGETIYLTPIESRLLYLLRHTLPVSYDTLISEIYNCTADHKTRKMLDKHIDNIRVKLRYTAISVHCVRSHGYVLLFDVKKNHKALSLYRKRKN